MNRPYDELEWYDALARYLAANDNGVHLKHANAIVNVFISLFEEIGPSFSQHGDIWLHDILALTRYRGNSSGKVFELLKSALERAALGIPEHDEEGLAFFASVWQSVAEKVVVETTERELQDQSVLSGLADIPFGVHNLLRDWFPAKPVRGEAERKRENWFEDICGEFFDSMKLLYEDPRTRRLTHCIEPEWAPSFDTSILLFAGGLRWERERECMTLIQAVLDRAKKEGRLVSLNGWKPGVRRLQSSLLPYWQTRRTLAAASSPVSSDTVTENTAKENYAAIDDIFAREPEPIA